MYRQSLDQLLEEILRHVYRVWYALPRRSTLPEVNRLRLALADRLESLPQPADTAECARALIEFAAALRQLPQAEEAGGEALARLAAAQTGGQAVDCSPARVAALVALLRLEDPPQALIVAMNYAPAQARAVWEEVDTTIGARLDQLPVAEHEQVEAIRQQVMAQTAAAEDRQAQQAAYITGLKALEQLPAVIRVAAPVFFANKYVGEPPTYYSGDGISMGIPKDLLIPEAAAAADEPLALPQADLPAADAPVETRVPFFADVRFPTKVKQGEVQWLSVQLKLEQSAESRSQATLAVAFAAAPSGELPPPEYVEVRLVAPDFREQTGVWERTMMVYPSRDSQPVVFLLTSDVLGRKRITVDFYHKGRMIASLHFESEVVKSAAVRGGALTLMSGSLEMGEFSANPPPPADLELRVARAVESNQLGFVLNSSLPQETLRSQPVGQIKLTGKDPQTFFGDRLQKLTDLARAAPDALNNPRLMQEVEALGEGLFELLLPPELQQLYWERIQPLIAQGVIKTLLINSDEPWIPWELIKPYRYNDADDNEQRGPFLVEQLSLSRWLARPLPPPVTVKQAALVMPEVNLPNVQEEQQFFAALAQERSFQLQGPLQVYNEVIDSLRLGGFQLLHFATHGVFNAGDADRSELLLGNQNLTPADLVGSDLIGLRRARPLVFLNACASGKADLTLVGSGGWAYKFFAEGRASAFIGTLWEVSDDLAALFSRIFYSELAEGRTLGEAMLSARLRVRDQEPANPTWLAYALYGDPNGKVMFG